MVKILPVCGEVARPKGVTEGAIRLVVGNPKAPSTIRLRRTVPLPAPGRSYLSLPAH